MLRAGPWRWQSSWCRRCWESPSPSVSGGRPGGTGAGGILLAAGAVGLFLHPFAPLHGRGVEPTLTDTIHQVVTTVWALIVFAAVAFGAAAYRGRFRLYSIATLVVLPVFGWLAANLDEARAADLPTPWQGFFERVNAYALMAWLVVLAVTVMRRSLNHVTVETGAPEVPQTRAQTREPSLVGRG